MHLSSSSSSSPAKKRRASAFQRARLARLAAIQAFYQMIYHHQTASAVIQEFVTLRFPVKTDYTCLPNVVLFQKLLLAADEKKDDILVLIQNFLVAEWSYDRLDDVMKSILYISTVELLERLSDVPAPVIITEYVQITASFYAGTEVSFVNGYLDRLARNLGYPMSRPGEAPHPTDVM